MTSAPEPLITVLHADDDEDQRILVRQLLRESRGARHSLTTVPDGHSALTALRERVFEVALLDLSMPGLDGLEVLETIAGDPARPQVIFVSGQGTVATATRAMKLGAYDFIEKPVDRERLLTLVWKAAEAARFQSKAERLEAVVDRDAAGLSIVTRDPGMRHVLEVLERVAASDASVLVTGESGTGKELIARELHRLSGRQGAPLVALNCAAVAETLAESELFGHEKGAFTGAATRKMGLIELADGGTLFLDEIGDLGVTLQAKLLRVLESRVFRRVGGTREIPTRFRLVSATNRALQARVDQGAFRGDLFYRINAIVLELPPLRDRPGDILLLARHFLEEILRGEAANWTIADEAQGLLVDYPWPGNVRELRNVVERAALLCKDRTIRPADLGLSITLASSSPTSSGEVVETLPSLNLAELEHFVIKRALIRSQWHQGRAAGLLGISDRTLHRKIRALGLRRPD